MAIPTLSEEMIRANSTAQSFRRGEEYYSSGSVISLVQRGDQIEAEVQGSNALPYLVTVDLADGDVVVADCTCPYDWGGWCKHVVAALLACMEEPETVEERESLSSLLADLDADSLRTLIEDLAAERPDIVPLVERQITAARVRDRMEAVGPKPTGDAEPVVISVDLQAIRRQVRAMARRGVADIDVYVEQVERLLDAGHGRDALAVLDAVTDEIMAAIDLDEPYGYREDTYRGDYDDDDDYGSEYYSLFEELGSLWAQVVLSADLSAEEREAYQDQLAGWQEELDGVEWLGDEDFFDLAIGALEYYWDYPPLQRVLQGEITQLGAWEDAEPPWFADDLAVARLKVLERQGRFQEYLHLAQAESEVTLYVNMLARMGRTEEAVAEALQYLDNVEGAQMVAGTLYDTGQVEAALQVAEHGLTLEGYQKHDLAVWLRDRAVEAGKPALALKAGTLAVLDQRQLADYRRLQELAGDRWQEMRGELLARLRVQDPHMYRPGAIDIFLHEGLIDDAIAGIGPFSDDARVIQVMEAAVESRSDWVIQTAQGRAERIMDAGKAKYYDTAVDWLRRARDAYRAAGRERDWEEYLAHVREVHGRKWKLMGLIDARMSRD